MNDLHRNLAGKILTHIRSASLAHGDHLTEQRLQQLLGTSRQPIRAALAHLADHRVVKKVPNKGFYVDEPLALSPEDLQRGDVRTDEALYARIAADRLSRALGDRISENDLMRRYDVSRLQLRRVLTRIAGEGWIERNEGRGWSFASLIDSVDAYRESYELRQMLEPQGLMAPGFQLDRGLLEMLRDQQQALRDGGWQTLGQMELFETNSAFHEGLAQMSGNRFLHATIARMNQLRRLVEYRHTLDRQRVLDQNGEHLQILDALEDGQVAAAAELLRQHIGGAKSRKVTATVF